MAAALNPIDLLITATNQVTPVINAISADLGQLFSQLTSVRGLYDLLIKQNETLQASLLSTAATLAGTNKILQNGLEIKDPKEAILALQAPVKEAVDRVREGSLELVGVTSAELIPLLQIVTGQASQIGANLNESADLTLDFAASLGTLGIPLGQARQEITSILTGTIDINSTLAKSLNITNAQVNQYKAQGTLVEKLRERLSAFRAGNALAAQTIDGISSNIAELFQVITQKAGEPLLAPIVAGLKEVYTFLTDNEDAIAGFFESITGFVQLFGGKAVEIFKTLYPAIEQLASVLLDALGSSATILGVSLLVLVDTLVLLAKAIAPVLKLVADLARLIADFAKSDLGGIVVQTGLIIAALAIVIPYLITLGPLVLVISSSLLGVPGAIARIIAGFPALIAGIGATILSLGPLLPILAVAAAGITLAVVVKQTGDLKKVNDELDEYNRQGKVLGDSAINIATGLTELAAIKERDGELTATQTAQYKKYQIGAAGISEGLRIQNKDLKDLQPANKEQENAIAAQIAANELLIRTLEKASGGTTLTGRDLEKLGTSFEQLNVKADAALRTIASGGDGDSTKFNAAAKELVSITEQQVAMGVITREQAVTRLEGIRNDVRVEMSIQQGAQKQITAIRQQEVDNQVKLLDLRTKAVNASVASEKLGEAAGAAEVTRLKGEQLQIQLANVKREIDEEETLRGIQLNAKLRSLQAELAAETTVKGQNRINAEIAGVQTGIAQSSQRLSELKNQAVGLESDITVNAAEEIKQRRTEELKDYDERQAILQAGFDSRLVSEANFNKESLANTKNKIAAELLIIEEQKKTIDPEDVEGLEALAVKEAGLRAKLVKADEDYEAKKTAIALRGFSAQEQELESSYARKLISEEAYTAQSLALSLKRAEVELADILRLRALIPKGDTTALEESEAKEAEVRDRIFNAQEKAATARFQAKVKHFDNEQTITEAALSAGEITEQQFNDRSLANTRGKLAEELEEIARQRSLIKSNDKAALEALAAQEASVRDRQLEALERYQEQQVAIIERAQRKAIDEVGLIEAERLVQIQELENKRLISSSEADRLRLNQTGIRIKEELDLEREKLADLRALPAIADPIKEEERQGRIRDSRRKTFDLTVSLLESEDRKQKAQEQKLIEAIDRRVQAYSQAVQKENLELEKQQLLSDALVKSLENQNKLLNARKSLASSLQSFYESELGILAEISTSEVEKKELAETTAVIRLRGLRQQQEIERDILELNIKQRDAALEQEKAKNRIAQSQNLADIAQATADVAKTAARTDLTPQARALQQNADELNLTAKLQAGVGLISTEGLLKGQSALNEKIDAIERGNLARSQQSQENRARAELANSRVSPVQQRQDKLALETDINNQTFRTTDRDSIRQQTREFNEGRSSNLFNTNAPSINLPQLQLTEIDIEKAMVGLLAKAQAGLNAANKQPGVNAIKPVQLTGDLKIENTINVNLNSAKDKQLGVDIEGTILNSLEQTFKAVELRLGK